MQKLLFFQTQWKPKCWGNQYRFVFVIDIVKDQQKEPVQLDMFAPYSSQYEYKVVLTNKNINVKKLINYHNGRGYQENIFGELKSHIQMDYIPTRNLSGNQIYLLACFLVHNLNREIKMICEEPSRGTTEKRSPQWVFDKISSLRNNLVNIAGCLTNPKGKLTLTMNANEATEQDYQMIMDALAT
jgi:hypothetical protein